MSRATVLSIVLSLLACCSPGRAADHGAGGKLKANFVRGHAVETQLTLPAFQTEVRRLFRGSDVAFHLNGSEGFTKKELLGVISSSDIFYINTHAGDSKTWGTQIIKARPAASGEAADQFIFPADIRRVVGDDGGPKLVIINGCRTTAFHLENSKQMDQRLATGFAIGPRAKGRAYLGWQSYVAATVADKYLVNKLLKVWTTPQSDGSYLTLAEAQQKAGQYSSFNRLNIVGDQQLRYDFLRGYVGTVPITGVWKLEPPRDPREVNEWGELGPLLLHLRFVLHNNGRLTAYYEVQGTRRDAKEILHWRLHGDGASPQLTVTQVDSQGKRKETKTFSLTVDRHNPRRVGIRQGDTRAWALRLGDAPD